MQFPSPIAYYAEEIMAGRPGPLLRETEVFVGAFSAESISQMGQSLPGGDPDNPSAVNESWRVSTLTFTNNDDSDATFVVPASTEYEILSIYVTLASTATAGNRLMSVQVLDASDNIIASLVAAVAQAASLTYRYLFGVGLADAVAVRDSTYVTVSLPLLFLAAGQKLRVFDKAAIAAAADDMTVRVQIASRSVA